MMLFFINFYMFKNFEEGFTIVTQKSYLSATNSTFIFDGNLLRLQALFNEQMFLKVNKDLASYYEALKVGKLRVSRPKLVDRRHLQEAISLVKQSLRVFKLEHKKTQFD